MFFYCFQGAVGSFLGVGPDPILSRQLLNAAVSQLYAADPEIEACSYYVAHSFIS